MVLFGPPSRIFFLGHWLEISYGRKNPAPGYYESFCELAAVIFGRPWLALPCPLQIHPLFRATRRGLAEVRTKLLVRNLQIHERSVPPRRASAFANSAVLAPFFFYDKGQPITRQVFDGGVAATAPFPRWRILFDSSALFAQYSRHLQTNPSRVDYILGPLPIGPLNPSLANQPLRASSVVLLFFYYYLGCGGGGGGGQRSTRMWPGRVCTTSPTVEKSAYL